MTRRIHGLSEIATDYKAIVCDVWGVVHNGVVVHQAAVDALANYRGKGGKVVLLTNSPRPKAGVKTQLDDMGVRSDAYDDIVTSGDATRVLIEQAKGKTFHLGPTRDEPLFDGLNVELANKNDGDHIVCTGLFDDENEQPEDYRSMLSALAERQVPFICANPDLIVERGEKMIPCAGALAKLYDELGGQTLVAGKPHKPIYDLAMGKLKALDPAIEKSDVIAIGDGMPTDVAGAQKNGFDLLYISAGIHHEEYGPADNPDVQALEDFLQKQGANPTVWQPRLNWQGA